MYGLHSSRNAIALLWIFGMAGTAHLLYSTLGFNPTDDGFTLAYSRRLLDGQVPHRDFIMIRPSLSPLLHLPEILLGGPYTYWFSRFVFFLQCACLTWFGTAFVVRGLDLAISFGQQCALAVVSFVLCCHSFPAMAWHTVDGLLFVVVGLYLRLRSSSRSVLIGYFMLGLAYLCKQSFLPVAPLTLVLFRDWKNWRCLVASALPGLLYTAMLFLAGGMSDALQQLLSQSGIVKIGLISYLNMQTALGLMVGVVVTDLLHTHPLTPWPRSNAVRLALGLAVTGTVLLLAIVSLAQNSLHSSSFALLGMLCGHGIHTRITEGRAQSLRARTGLGVALLAWSASLSLGYNSPALCSGIMVTFLAGISYPSARQLVPRALPLLSVIMLLLSITAFHYTRTHHIYRDRPAPELTASVEDVLTGGRLLRTNPNTHAFLADLASAIDTVVGRGFRYAIVPAVAGHWVLSEQKNPLPIDWAQGTELNIEALRHRVITSIESQRHDQLVIVQKVHAPTLASGLLYLDYENKAYYSIVSYIRSHLEKVGETQYCDIYR